MAFDVEGAKAAGYSDAEIQQYLTTQGGNEPASQPAPQQVAPVQQVDPRQSVIDKMGPVERTVTGIGAGMYDAYKGGQQLGARIGNLLGITPQETVDRITREGQEARNEFAPLRDQSTAAKVGEFVGKVVPFTVVPGGVAGGAGRRLLTAGLSGAAQGAAEFVPEGGSRASNIALGGTMGAGTSGLMSLLGKGINAFTKSAPDVNPQYLAESQRFGIPATLSELQTGKASRLDVFMERVPSVFGTSGFRKQQQEAAKDAATTHFGQYVVDPTLDTTAAMKVSNDSYINDLYAKVRQSTKTVPTAQAPETNAAAKELLDRYPAVFDTLQDTKLKNIIANVNNDTAGKAKLSFDDLWEARKGLGEAIGGAKTPTEQAQLSALYSAVSNDMENMLKGSTGVWGEFKAANDAFKQYSVKFDAMRKAYDTATGTIGAGQQGFFSPQKYATELKRLANDPAYKKNVRWTGDEINEMTGLANILQVTKRAGEFTENPPTGQRLIPYITGGGVGASAMVNPGATAASAGVAASAALVTKFLTTTDAGKKLATVASKVEPTSPKMAKIVNQVYKQLPKVAAQTGIGMNRPGRSQLESSMLSNQDMNPLSLDLKGSYQ